MRGRERFQIVSSKRLVSSHRRLVTITATQVSCKYKSASCSTGQAPCRTPPHRQIGTGADVATCPDVHDTSGSDDAARHAWGVYFLHFAFLELHVPAAFLAAAAQALAQPGEPFASSHLPHFSAFLSQQVFDPLTCPQPLHSAGHAALSHVPFIAGHGHFEAQTLAHFSLPSTGHFEPQTSAHFSLLATEHLVASFVNAQPLLIGHLVAVLLHCAFLTAAALSPGHDPQCAIHNPTTATIHTPVATITLPVLLISSLLF